MTGLTVQGTEEVTSTAQVSLPQGRAEVVVDVKFRVQELRRRQRGAFKPLLSLDLLNLLLTMPLSSPVPAHHFSDYDWRRLEAGSRMGAVDITETDGGTCATRCAGVPLTVLHATVRARRWRFGLSVASRFAPYCPRDLVLDYEPSDDLDLILEANYLGIGIRLRGGGSGQNTRRVIEPAPFTPARYTGASWLFAERMLAQHAMNLEDEAWSGGAKPLLDVRGGLYVDADAAP